MNSLNSILLEGNLTRLPETKTLAKGNMCCTFSVASNRYYRQADALQKEVSFFDVETWSGLAERCAQELGKGRGVRVVGRLKQERWVDTEGQTRSKIKIVAEHVEFKPIFNKEKADEEPDPQESNLSDDSLLEDSPV